MLLFHGAQPEQVPSPHDHHHEGNVDTKNNEYGQTHLALHQFFVLLLMVSNPHESSNKVTALANFHTMFRCIHKLS